MTLYDLTGEYSELMARYETAESDDEAEQIWQQIEGLACDITVKADAYARVMRNMQANAKAYADEADRLTALADRETKNANRLCDGIRNAMLLVGATEIPTSIGTWKAKLNPPKCDITDIHAVPEQFRKPIQPPEIPYTIDKAAAKKWYKETGEIIPGLDIHQETAVVFK